jgi:protocatechuate 3,4-dioxygenase beta subunit
VSFHVTRRQTLGALGSLSLGTLLAACAGGETAQETAQETGTASAGSEFDGAASCTLAAEQTQGPYYFNVDSIRSDIREDRAGVPLRLAVRVQEAGPCTPIANAVVDIWHCDAGGVYSGFESASLGAGGVGPGGGEAPAGGPPPGAPPGGSPPAAVGGSQGEATPTDAATYLRGAQVTNADGVAEFLTIYPGWYQGRTVHIHAKVHLDSSTLVTTQLYMDDAITEQVYAQAPYNQRTGRETFNDFDGIFDSGDGETPILTLTPSGDGWLGMITLGVLRQ